MKGLVHQMIQLLETGAYLVNGNELIPDNGEALSAIKAKTGKETNKAEAAKETIAYSILKNHNTSDNMDKLKIDFPRYHFRRNNPDSTCVRTYKVPSAIRAYKLPQLTLRSRRNDKRGRPYVWTDLR
jgi:hypothetical protein